MTRNEKKVIERNILLEQRNIVLREEVERLHKLLAIKEFLIEDYQSWAFRICDKIRLLGSYKDQNMISELFENIDYLLTDMDNEYILDEKKILKRIEILSNEITNQNKDLMHYCGRHEKLYIYGTGKKAKRLSELLTQFDIEIEGYVVSDNQQKLDMFNSKEVKFLSEIIDKREDVGILLGVNFQNAKEVKAELKKQNVNDYLYFE